MQPAPLLDPHAPAPDPLALLARADKWQLGAGDGIIFAPRFPLWLDAPGFWDEATFYQHAFAPLFTVALLDVEGREIPLAVTSRGWTPAALTLAYEGDGIQATEVRTVQPGGVFVSEWRLRATVPRTANLVAWTAQDTRDLDLGSLAWDGALSFVRTVHDRREVPLRVLAALTCMGGATTWSASLSERSAMQPHWRLAPFGEQWGRAGLPKRLAGDWAAPRGLLYAAVHRAIALGAGEGTAAFAMRLADADASTRPSAPRATTTPGSVGAAPPTLAAASRRRWRDLLARAPSFRCSDPYLETCWSYRWFGLWLNAIEPGRGNYRWPSICEGVGPHHQPVAHSAPCHVRELRWLRDREHARGVLRTFLHHQKPDGSLHGRVGVDHLDDTGFHHADWGGALLALDAVAPDDDFVAEVLPRLSRYANWLVRTHDADASGMFDVVDAREVGQGHAPRFHAVDRGADALAEGSRSRLKGIDATVHAYVLFRALERLADRLGDEVACRRWRTLAERTRRAVRERMWDDGAGMFFDVDTATGERTGVRAAVCFYPYGTDLVDERHIDGLRATLLDPSEFWTRFPVPSSSLRDPSFSAVAEWRGARRGCPWNGRVWPVTSSLIVEALARQAESLPELRVATVHLVQRFVRMLTFDGDPHRPNCFEHYDPLTGAASLYRGIDDHQRSWVNDLIAQYVVGVRPREGGIVIDPFPFGLERAEMAGIHVRGRALAVRIDGERFTVTVDGEARSALLGTALEISD